MNNQGKKLVKAGITLSVLTSTLLHATNGDHLIGTGAKARGMGGAGIALSHGAESALLNPALITSVENTEISFGGTVFMPKVESTGATVSMFTKSAADMNVIPEVSIASKIKDGFYAGIGIWGTAGMGVDYRDDGGMNANMVTNLQLMQFGVPLAFKKERFSIGVAPILQYGALDIQYDGTGFGGGPTGSGIAQDLAFGFSAGITVDVTDNFTIGAVYKSPIKMDYSYQISTAAAGMGMTVGDDLEQPAEIGVGIGFKMNEHAFAIDYKQIKWSDAAGYDYFGWEDQDVIAVGYEYSTGGNSFRIGYNHGESPVVDNLNPAIDVFNLIGFPATSEDHYTAGATFKISDQTSIDLAYVYSPKSTKTFDTTGMPMPSVTTTHSENSVSFQLTYNF